jgi:hypothetical protein
MCGRRNKNNAHACLLYSEVAANKSVGRDERLRISRRFAGAVIEQNKIIGQ